MHNFSLIEMLLHNFTKVVDRETAKTIGTGVGAGLLDLVRQYGREIIHPVRDRFSLIPGGKGLRHFIWGKGASIFKDFFPILLSELDKHYQYVVIDTPPEFNVLTRTALASSDLVVMPVDSSAMSIDGLRELVASASHIQGPIWTIARTMVHRQASRVRKMSQERLEQSIELRSPEYGSDYQERAIEDSDEFIDLLSDSDKESSQQLDPSVEEGDTSPIFLLNNIIYRSELQNKLSFQGKTSFDLRVTKRLAAEYRALAVELSDILQLQKANPDSGVNLQEFVVEDTPTLRPSLVTTS